jgi:glycosidase
MRSLRRASFVVLAFSAAGGVAVACGSDMLNQMNYGSPPDATPYDAGSGRSDGGTGYGYGYGGGPAMTPDAGKGSGGGKDSGVKPFDAFVGPACTVADQLCPEVFTYPFNGESSVSVMGDYSPTGWTVGTPMVHSGTGQFGSEWYALVPVPYNQPVQYKFKVNGSSTWVTDPNNPVIVDAGGGNTNSLDPPITCKNPTCAQSGALAAGVFDWRDAVIYFAFIDRFNEGTSTNPKCNVSGASTGQISATSANYLGGNWAGVTAKIESNYFTDLGVNTIWITVPVKNADTVVGAGVGGSCSGTTCNTTQYEYSAYHGYWPTAATADGGAPAVEPCFGTEAELHALVKAAHAKNLKVLFDYAMVDIHTSSPIYTAHVNDNPSWFTQPCQCGAPSCSDYDDYKCWFAPYLAHYDFTNSSAARTYSVNSALALVEGYGNDAFRLDAIKQVDPSWLASLRPQITTYEGQKSDGGVTQHFYMVGETYDFNDMAYIRSFINPDTGLDGQFDFPLRYRIVQAMLLRDTGMMLDPAIPDGNPWTFNSPAGMAGLQAFMDFNDSFYPSGTVMSTFVGNQDLPRSIHYTEQTIPAWLGPSVDDALTTNGSDDSWTNEPALETDPNTYERLANAFAVLFMTKGAPLIYYGDEIGLPGAGDPDNRRMMQWTGYSTAQQGLHDRLANLLKIRNGHPALRRGTRTTLSVSMDLWLFSETTTVGTATDTVYVAINRSDAPITATGVPAGLPELVTTVPASGMSTGNDSIPARTTLVWSSYVPPAGDAGADGG